MAHKWVNLGLLGTKMKFSHHKVTIRIFDSCLNDQKDNLRVKLEKRRQSASRNHSRIYSKDNSRLKLKSTIISERNKSSVNNSLCEVLKKDDVILKDMFIRELDER